MHNLSLGLGLADAYILALNLAGYQETKICNMASLADKRIYFDLSLLMHIF